jgi:hypothetical protein
LGDIRFIFYADFSYAQQPFEPAKMRFAASGAEAFFENIRENNFGFY